MDSANFIVFLIFNSIKLNTAENANSEMPLKTTVGLPDSTSTSRPLFSKFEWAHLVGENAKGDLQPSADSTNDDDFNNAMAKAVYWIPTVCDSMTERGYTCLACGESLHCMASNFGLRAVCGGRRPYCHNGVCSYIRGEKCKLGDSIQHDSPDEYTSNFNSTLLGNEEDLPQPKKEV